MMRRAQVLYETDEGGAGGGWSDAEYVQNLLVGSVEGRW